MSKILAIKGDKNRGNEVIALLEMLGGRNIDNYRGTNFNYAYFIDDYDYNNICFIDVDAALVIGNYVIFTLNEFKEKYPYKVGDVVKTGTDEEGIIKQIKWVDNDIVYWVESNKTCKWAQTLSVDVLDKYNRLKSNDIEHIWATTVESNKRDREDVLFDSIIWHLRNSVNNGKQHLSGGDCEAYFRELVKKVKMYKPTYPTTIEECYDVLKVPTEDRYVEVDNPVFLNKLIISFTELLIARNAYWKIAGEQMGLGKPWDSTYGCGEWGYRIEYSINENKIYFQDYRILVNHTLVFPTEEMRDAFYENFKDLIEQCKELL